MDRLKQNSPFTEDMIAVEDALVAIVGQRGPFLRGTNSDFATTLGCTIETFIKVKNELIKDRIIRAAPSLFEPEQMTYSSCANKK